MKKIRSINLHEAMFSTNAIQINLNLNKKNNHNDYYKNKTANNLRVLELITAQRNKNKIQTKIQLQ